YRVTMLAACMMSTYQPQPAMAALPSRSQLHPALTLQVAVRTPPDAAARIGVPFGTARSTPLWVGRPAVRNPETISAATGTVQPDAAISPANAQRSDVSEPTERAAPAASLFTMDDACDSCLAYASG